jgi:hypothetical protein
MGTEKTFSQQIDVLQKEVRQLDDDFDDAVVEETASRLRGLNFSPPVITPMDRFLTMRSQGLLAEIDRILAMPDAEACALAPDDSKECADLRVQYIGVLLFYYKKLLRLRKGNLEEWDEVDELYVHD